MYQMRVGLVNTNSCLRVSLSPAQRIRALTGTATVSLAKVSIKALRPVNLLSLTQIELDSMVKFTGLMSAACEHVLAL